MVESKVSRTKSTPQEEKEAKIAAETRSKYSIKVVFDFSLFIAYD